MASNTQETGDKSVDAGPTADSPKNGATNAENAGAVNGRRRVKLYMLNEERVWHDQGTGHVSPIYLEKLNGLSLIVRSETDSSILLESRIHPKTAYQKQVETLIVWSEHDNDYALSFQEKASCDEIWERICHFQGKDPAVELTQDCAMNANDNSVDDMSSVVDYQDTPLMQDTGPPITLPPCELSKLEEISEMFSGTLMTPARREKLASAIEEDGYLKQLLELFHMCEDLENAEGLHHLYDIFKSIFTLNRVELFEEMFEQDTIFDVVGVLEYDPSLTTPTKHREYLRTQAKFKEVVPFSNQKLTEKIHQTYRMQYIQDVMLPAPSVFEENLLSTLSSLIYFNKSSIVSMIQEDDKFLQTLFQQICDDELDDGRRRDLVFFLKEFCAFSQTLQQDSKNVFFKNLIDLGILKAIEMVLGFDDHSMKSAAVDVFTYILENSPSSVREFVIQESNNAEDDELLINLVIEQMISDPDPELGGAVQLMGTIKTLVDPENMVKSKTEKTEFLGFFYKHSMHILTAPLFANTVNEKPSRDDYKTAQLLSLILELLTFCIEHHAFNIKNYTLSKDLIRRVLVLLKSRHSFVALAALRLLRKVVGLKDDFYNRYIMRGDLFKPVIDAFLQNGTKYNLLNSALIELFEFLRSEDIKSLTKYVIEKHYHAFEKVEYVNTFKSLKLRYDQNEDTSTILDGHVDNAPALMQNSRFRRDARTLEDEEEMWFDQDEYDEPDSMLPDMLKPKSDLNLDQIINRYFVDRKYFDGISKENEAKDSPPRIINRSNSPISMNFNLNRNLSPTFSGTVSPLHTPTTSPINSPNNSPASSPNNPPPKTPAGSPLADKSNTTAAVQTKKPLIGLVDYPDDEEEDEEETTTSSPTSLDSGDGTPAAKRPRLSS